MSVLIDRGTRVIVQGITGNHGRFHAGQMIEYGTDVAGGTRPGKGGETILERPIFDTVAEARERTGADCSVIFVPPPLAADAILEAVDAGIRLVVCITEGIPIRDMQLVRARVDRGGSRLLGPNCPGLLTPDRSKVGIMPGTIASPGSVGVVSRSGTLTYEAVYALTERGIGQSTCIGIGGDPVNGTDFIDVLELFERDAGTDRVVLIGEIGGTDEQRAADYIRREMSKPVVAFIAGRMAPEGKTMGHAGALVEGAEGSAGDKIDALRSAGARIATHPEEIPDLVSG
ncbi:MAG: succinate--CoA ligase subunit alpha [Spirochaetaceae bacterium]|nr:succinate--CoA ligase subunit alpha [Spirochaetaceae bacterium]